MYPVHLHVSQKYSERIKTLTDKHRKATEFFQLQDNTANNKYASHKPTKDHDRVVLGEYLNEIRHTCSMNNFVIAGKKRLVNGPFWAV